MQQQTYFVSAVRGIKPETFQLASINPQDKESRFYMEILAGQTEFPNFQGYQFTNESMGMMVEGYKQGKPQMVNHQYSEMNVGFGETTDAAFNGRDLILQTYIRRGMQTPNGPFGSTDDLITAVEDGFLKDASIGLLIYETSCSICSKPGPLSPYEYYFSEHDEDRCPHVRLREYEVDNNVGGKEMQTAYALIDKAEPLEISLVWEGADPEARVVNRNLQLSRHVQNDFDNLSSEQRDRIIHFSREFHQKIKGEPKMSTITQEQFAALQSQKDAADAQIAAKDTEIASLKTVQSSFEKKIEAKDKEIAEFKSKQAENEQAIADGKVAREKAIESCLEQFKRTEPDTAADELNTKVEAEKAALETFSLDTIYKREASYESFADKMYPDQAIKKPESKEGGGNQRTRKTRGRR